MTIDPKASARGSEKVKQAGGEKEKMPTTAKGGFKGNI